MKISLWNLTSESYKSVIKEWKSWLKISFAPYLLIAGGYGLSLFAPIFPTDKFIHHLNQSDFSAMLNLFFSAEVLMVIFSWLLISVAAFMIPMIGKYALITRGYRYGILKDQSDKWLSSPFNWRVVVVLGYSMVVILAVTLYLLATTVVLMAVHHHFHHTNLTVAMVVLAVMGFIYLWARFIFVYAEISLDHTASILNSWKITKGHTIKIISLLLMLVLSYAVFSVPFLCVGYGILSISSSLFAIGFAVLLAYVYELIIWAIGIQALSSFYRELTAKPTKSKAVK